MVVGFISASPSESTGNSSGKPPACRTPRFTATASSRRCELQLTSSLQLLQMPISGFLWIVSSEKPSDFIQLRCRCPSSSPRPLSICADDQSISAVERDAKRIAQEQRLGQDVAFVAAAPIDANVLETDATRIVRVEHGAGEGREVDLVVAPRDLRSVFFRSAHVQM